MTLQPESTTIGDLRRIVANRYNLSQDFAMKIRGAGGDAGGGNVIHPTEDHRAAVEVMREEGSNAIIVNS